MTDIIMPKAGMAMETGKIVKWLVKEGDAVSAGDMILEIETDKVNMEVEAFASGTVLKIFANEGDEIPVTQVIGYIGEPGEKVPDAPAKLAVHVDASNEKQAVPAAKPAAAGKALSHGGRIPATPLAKTLAKQRGIDLSTVTPSGHLGHIKAADVPDAPTAASGAKATPLARAMAKAQGVDLSGIGGGGRIYAKDVEDAMAAAKAAQVKTVPLMEGDTTMPLSGMRKVIARRMFESHIEAPPVTMHAKADVSALLAHRRETNAKGGEKLSINDYVIEACAQALHEMPEANISFGGDCIVQRGHVNIGVAVALEGGGLIVPVLRDADQKNIDALSAQMKDLAKRARSGKLAPDEYTGGTFTISNLGMMGITYFTPILNTPESMILGVNTIEKVLTMSDDDKLFNRDMMGLSLTFDHRAHDGASAALFMQRVVQKLERFAGEGETNGK